MSGFFGCVSRLECVNDVFYGTDYHSHLGTKRAGMAFYDGKKFVRSIHSLENGYFRNKFEDELPKFGEAQMGVAPLVEIVVVDVHATRIGHLAVDDDGLAVVAVVEVCEVADGAFREWREIVHLHTVAAHALVIDIRDRDIGNVLIDEAYLHALPSLLFEQLLDGTGTLVDTKVEVFDMDIVLGIANVVHQHRLLLAPLGDDVDVVAARQGVGAERQQPCQGDEMGMQPHGVDVAVEQRIHTGCREVGLCSLMLALVDAMAAEVHPKHEVKQYACYNRKEYHLPMLAEQSLTSP